MLLMHTKEPAAMNFTILVDIPMLITHVPMCPIYMLSTSYMYINSQTKRGYLSLPIEFLLKDAQISRRIGNYMWRFLG